MDKKQSKEIVGELVGIGDMSTAKTSSDPKQRKIGVVLHGPGHDDSRGHFSMQVMKTDRQQLPDMDKKANS